MNRKYTTNEFREVAKRLRSYFKDANLTTDIIVGFPGETNEEFTKTYEFLKEIKFYKMHVFKYSIRKGTKAENMPNQISPEIKEVRSNKLLELSDYNEISYLESYIGKSVEVLFEEEHNEYYKGHTSNYIMVKVKSNEDISNIILKVKINERDKLELIGEI